MDHICLPTPSWWTFRLFPVWAIKDNAAVNIHMEILTWTYIFFFLLGKYLAVEILGHTIL